MPAAIDTGNIIEDNEIVGNANGIFINTGVQGNTIRRNTIVGNPPVQVAVDHNATIGYDINSVADEGANTFHDNVCITAVNAPCPKVSRGDSSVGDKLQFVGCATRAPTASCELTVSEWNRYFIDRIDSGAPALTVGDGKQRITVEQYLKARIAAGL